MITIPVLVSLLVEYLIGFTDTAYLGIVGETELAADSIIAIELCAGLGNDDVICITKAIERKAIVRVIRFDLHTAFNHQSADKMF